MLFWIVGTILCVGTVVPQVAQADAICKSGGTYNTYYPGDCDKYYKCENGQATEESCGWLHRFDENSSECKFHLWFIGSVNCSEATAPNKPTIAPTGKTTKGTTITPKTGNPTTSPTKATSKTSATATTPDNGSTTKKSNSAGSTKFSILLTAICILSVSSRHLFY